MLCLAITLLVTGVLLRSDVFVDIISLIEIVTTTRELLLGESPEVCHIQAFDSKGKKQLHYNCIEPYDQHVGFGSGTLGSIPGQAHYIVLLGKVLLLITMSP